MSGHYPPGFTGTPYDQPDEAEPDTHADDVAYWVRRAAFERSQGWPDRVSIIFALTSLAMHCREQSDAAETDDDADYWADRSCACKDAAAELRAANRTMEAA